MVDKQKIPYVVSNHKDQTTLGEYDEERKDGNGAEQD